ncbi:MAG: hypothetical protein U0354_08270 [Candidatus Sericytochromatia bacterium]
MKKIASIALSSMIALSLASCGSDNSVNQIAQNTQVEAQAAKKINLSMKKDESKAVKSASNSIKDLNVKIADKKSQDKASKSVEELKVTFSAVEKGKNDFDSSNNAMVARYSLTSMNQARTWEDGYRIGLQALEQMIRNNNAYVARVSWAAANATKSWENGYKVVAAALNHISADRPNSAYEACNLIMSMMNAATSWEDGYKSGYAALQIIGQTDNYTVKSIVDLALRQANTTMTYESGFNVIKNALQELRRANI